MIFGINYEIVKFCQNWIGLDKLGELCELDELGALYKGPITFIFLMFPLEKDPHVKLFDVSVSFNLLFIGNQGNSSDCFFLVRNNGGRWGGGWSEMRLATFIAFCLFQIFKGPITFIF